MTCRVNISRGEPETELFPNILRPQLDFSSKDLTRLGSEQAVREKGLIHVEGKEYVVQDGDVIRFRFNV